MELLLVIPIMLGALVCSTIVAVSVDASFEPLLEKTRSVDATKIIIIIAAGVIIPACLGLYSYSKVGEPSCDEYSDSDERGSYCLSYNDDGYEATPTQKIKAFKSTFFKSSFVLTSLTVLAIPDANKSYNMLEKLNSHT